MQQENIQKLIEIIAFPENHEASEVKAASDALEALNVSQDAIADTIKKLRNNDRTWEYEQQWDFDTTINPKINVKIDTRIFYTLLLLPIYCIICTVISVVVFYKTYESYNLPLDSILSMVLIYLALVSIYVIALFGFTAKKHWAWIMFFINAFTCLVGGLVNILMPKMNQLKQEDPFVDVMDKPLYNVIYIILGILSVWLLLKPTVLKQFSINKKRKNIAWTIAIILSAIFYMGVLFE